MDVKARLNSLRSQGIISRSIEQIVSNEFDKKPGIDWLVREHCCYKVGPTIENLTRDSLKDIESQLKLLENLHNDGKICRWVYERAKERGEEKLKALRAQREQFKKCLKMNPSDLRKTEERFEKVLRSLDKSYPGSSAGYGRKLVQAYINEILGELIS